MHTRSLTHTYTPAVICCQCYEMHAEFTDTEMWGQDSHHKNVLSAGNKAILNHTPLSLNSPHPDRLHSITLLTNSSGPNRCMTDTLLTSATSFTILYCFDISQQRITDALAYISRCYPMLLKEVDLSQSVSCRVFHTSHWCLCAFSLIASLLARTLSAASAENYLPFFHFTLTIDHFGESCDNDSNT